MEHAPFLGRHARTGLARALALACALVPALALAHTGPPPGTAVDGLTVRLAPTLSPGEVRFELTNTGDAPVSVLRTDSPLDERLAQDAFEIVRSVKGWPATERAAYTGRLYKRDAPGPEDFITLGPGRTVGRTLTLDDHYDVPGDGEYRVRFDAPLHVPSGIPEGARARIADALSEVPLTSAPMALTLRQDRNTPRARPPAFNRCDAAQQRGIIEAIGAAEGIAGESLASLTGLTESQRAGSPRYTRWFGRHSSDRYAIVTNGFDALAGALAGNTISPDCSCDESGVFAYVYPNRPYDVYLCPRFFAADTLGTDSRAGTFVHELSHFSALIGTDDHVYGQSAAASLATSDPNLSVDNADSYEYFAENTPGLPMVGDGGPVVPPPNETPPPPANTGRYAQLPPGTVLAGRLAQGEQALFEARDADTISLRSLSGDADLYVFDDPDLVRTSLVCSAEAFSAQSTLDVCELPSRGAWYVVVSGYTDASYEILASTVDAGGTAPGPISTGPSDDDPFGIGGTGGSAGGALGWGGIGLLGAALLARRRGSVRAGRPHRTDAA